jgi:N-acetylglucosamine-6-phosphate deacetylase
VVTAKTVMTPLETFTNLGVAVRDGKIERLAPAEVLAGVDADRRIHLDDGILAPGFIDLHNQGVLGHDVWDNEPEDYAAWMQGLTRFGVTSFHVTSTFDRAKFPRVVELTQQYPGGAEPLGIYLEGPFISTEKRGAIPPNLVSEPSGDLLAEILEVAAGKLHMMTVAPEREDAVEVAEKLRSAGVLVAIGHTNATYEETQRLVPMAANVTHCYNAMRGLHHRQPGTVGGVLLAEGVRVELIADGVHVHPAALRLALRLKGVDGASVVTDSIQAAGLPDGEYRSHRHGETIRIVNGESRLADGTLAGGTLTMDRGLKNIIDFTDINLAEGVRMCTLTPAKATAVDDRKGSLEPGKDADMVLLNRRFEVQATVVRGDVAYDKNSASEGTSS